MQDLRKIHSKPWVENITEDNRDSVTVVVRTADGRKGMFQVYRKPLLVYDKKTSKK